MIVGFTGTQRGMTPNQKASFNAALDDIDEITLIKEFHHGDCIGADADACEVVKKCFPETEVHRHPPEHSAKRAFTEADVDYPKKRYLDRNQDIVDACDILIAAPAEIDEKLRSGTWATVRRARKAHKDLLLIYPSGERKLEIQ